MVRRVFVLPGFAVVPFLIVRLIGIELVPQSAGGPYFATKNANAAWVVVDIQGRRTSDISFGNAPTILDDHLVVGREGSFIDGFDSVSTVDGRLIWRADDPNLLARPIRDDLVGVWRMEPDPGASPSFVRYVSDGDVTVPQYGPGIEPALPRKGEGLYSCRDTESGKVGFADEAGRVVIEPRFDAVSPFSGGFAVARMGDDAYLIDRGGDLSDKAWPWLDPPLDGLSIAQDAGGWTLVDMQGRDFLHGRRYGFMMRLTTELYAASDRQSGQFGVIEATGAWIVEPSYFRIHAWQDGLIAFAGDDQELGFEEVGLMDERGNVVFKCKGRSIRPAGHGLWYVSGWRSLVDADENRIVNGFDVP